MGMRTGPFGTDAEEAQAQLVSPPPDAHLANNSLSLGPSPSTHRPFRASCSSSSSSRYHRIAGHIDHSRRRLCVSDDAESSGGLVEPCLLPSIWTHQAETGPARGHPLREGHPVQRGRGESERSDCATIEAPPFTDFVIHLVYCFTGHIVTRGRQHLHPSHPPALLHRLEGVAPSPRLPIERTVMDPPWPQGRFPRRGARR